MAKRAFWGVVAGGVAAAGLATTVVLAATASAQTIAGQAVSATAQSDPAPSGKPKYCDRIDKALTRRQQAQTRLNGDANTRGSIAWLTAKAEAATAAGDDALAKLYTDKAALRSQLLEPLKTVTADLDALIQANCS